MAREQEIQDEIKEQNIFLDRYLNNIKSLLGEEGAKKVKKSMINHLVNNL